MIEIDGSRYSGSGTIVRQATAFAALTGRPVHLVNVRTRRPQPGLRHQHIRAVEAITELVNGRVEGLAPGSRELTFTPGDFRAGRRYLWDIGTAGSTTMLALAILPVLAFSPGPVEVELRGGLFQDCAPSVFHLQHVLLPLLRRMGLAAEISMGRPGYVPRGGGILRLTVTPMRSRLRSVQDEEPGGIQRMWGIALASHLEQRRVSERMAEAAQEVLGKAGYHAAIDVRHDTASLQAGAALALFADLASEVRLGADGAGAVRRSAESIGRRVSRQLLDDLSSGATLDRFATDQVVPFAALAEGSSRFRIPQVTDHLRACAWLAELFLGARVTIEARQLTIQGVGMQPSRGEMSSGKHERLRRPRCG